MEPTQAYMTAQDVGRTRPEASYGAIRVVIENYSDKAHLFGKSMIYLSFDNGATFTLLDWKISWMSRWKTLGREWPPHHVQIKRLDDGGLQLSYYEATYDGPVDYEASYLFAKKRWRL